MSSLARLLTGADADCDSGAPYLSRAEAREHALERWLRGAAGGVERRMAAHRRLRQAVERVGAQGKALACCSDAALGERYRQAARLIRRDGVRSQAGEQVFALVREAVARTLGKRLYDEQILGGVIMLRGMVAEMATGEGKTLVAPLAAAAAVAAGAHAHVVTVNDYLAARDAELLGPALGLLGIDVGVVLHEMEAAERRAAYRKPVCYVSNKELVFDYLKDHLASAQPSPAQRALRAGGAPLLLRGLHAAFIDEVDSILIDEARTPLIISESRAAGEEAQVCAQLLPLAHGLREGLHYRQTPDRQIELLAAGKGEAEAALAHLGGRWASPVWREQWLIKALSALRLYQRDLHYIVAEGKVQIVDESTGRVLADRSWEHGLHQMVEAKEGCEISARRETLARISYQQFFRKYLLLAGMSGTSREVAPELWATYRLRVVAVPPHRPCIRRHQPPCGFISADEKWQAVAALAGHLAAPAGGGRAVLIGTRSVRDSEQLSALFQEQGLTHAVLNARQDSEEARIVADAGAAGRITIATNMAGRGTDIRVAPEVLRAGGLQVILTEFHESARIDRQLYGRAARQGEPGGAVAMVSLQDEIFQRHARWWTLCARRLWPHLPAAPRRWLLRALAAWAQYVAQREARRLRLALLDGERRLREQLGFTGTGTNP